MMTPEADKTPPEQATRDAVDQPREQAAVKRGPHLRKALLAKLPRLVHRKWSADQWVGVSQDSDLRAIIELDADAFLEPLEAIVMATRK
jgi:hypothetical protein